MKTFAASAAFKPIPGTGLPAAIYAAIVLFSVTLFLVVGGPLWEAQTGAANVARFAISYAAVVPVAAVVLAAFGRFSWSRLVTTTGTSWAIKLVVTSVLYAALARTATVTLEAAPPPHLRAAPLPAASADYEPASAPFASGSLSVRVVRGGAPVEGAAVYVEAPAAGAALGDAGLVTLRITGSGYDAPVYLARTTDRVVVANETAVLHTAHVRGRDRSVANEPVPASAAPQELRVDERGVYEIRCDSHPDERATLVVVDHPYGAPTDRDGRAALAEVPEGAVELVVVAPDGAGARHQTIRISPEERTEATLDLAIARSSSETR